MFFGFFSNLLRSFGVKTGGKKVIVMCGPSGAGKSSLLKRIQSEYPSEFGFSISHTTRQPRPGEQHGIDYYYVDHNEMKEKIKNGEMLEYANVHSNIYGTSIVAVQDVTKTKRCILDIDVQGCENVKGTQLDKIACYIFIAPPSLEVLEQRLRSRGTETEDKIQTRLKNAKGEMAYMKRDQFWDAIIVNDNLDDAYIEFRAAVVV